MKPTISVSVNSGNVKKVLNERKKMRTKKMYAGRIIVQNGPHNQLHYVELEAYDPDDACSIISEKFRDLIGVDCCPVDFRVSQLVEFPESAAQF